MGNKDKVVILYSSGLDSFVNMNILKDLWNLQPILLFINYGQKSYEKELLYSKLTAEKYNLDLIVENVNLDVHSNLLINSSSDVCNDVKNTAEAPTYLVPYRNIFLAYRGIINAKKLGAKYVSFGFNVSEAGSYPDNTTRFLDNLNNLFISSTYYPYEPIIKFISASIHFTKTELVLIGQYLNLDFSLSFSCYNNYGYECGKCPSCILKQEAFRRANSFTKQEREKKIKELLELIEKFKEEQLKIF